MKWEELSGRDREDVLIQMYTWRREIAHYVGIRWSEEFLVALEAAISKLELSHDPA